MPTLIHIVLVTALATGADRLLLRLLHLPWGWLLLLVPVNLGLGLWGALRDEEADEPCLGPASPTPAREPL